MNVEIANILFLFFLLFIIECNVFLCLSNLVCFYHEIYSLNVHLHLMRFTLTFAWVREKFYCVFNAVASLELQSKNTWKVALRLVKWILSHQWCLRQRKRNEKDRKFGPKHFLSHNVNCIYMYVYVSMFSTLYSSELV